VRTLTLPTSLPQVIPTIPWTQFAFCQGCCRFGLYFSLQCWVRASNGVTLKTASAFKPSRSIQAQLVQVARLKRMIYGLELHFQRIRTASKCRQLLYHPKPLWDIWLNLGHSYTIKREFIGEIVASNNAGWAGYSLGRAMTNNLLLLAWPNGNQFVYSARIAS
jgi:hypothetical protein